MELTKTKYKQTEVGLIPEDWKLTFVDSVFDFSGGSQPPKSTFIFNEKEGYIRLLQIRDYKNDNHKTYIPEQLAQKKCSANDIMIGRYGPPIFQILRGIEGAYNVALLKAIPKGIDENYAYYFLKQDVLFEFVEKLSQRSSGQTGVDLNQLKNYLFAIPPTLTEQKAIATALSDVDALISSLKKLITKKKAIKQGAMQELLTPPNKGGKRLPGFSGEWEEVTLGDIGQCIIGLTYSPSNVKDSGTLVLRSSNIQDGRFSSHDNVYVDCDIPDKLKVQKNDILVCVRNGSRNLIGKSLKLSNALVGQTWGAFMSVYRSSYNDYVAHLFNSNVIQRQIEENLGATINQITNKTLNSFKVVIPKVIEEQKAIAQILSDMDLEIEALEAKKAKYQGIKQGMMQELLTGKTRLV